MNIIPPGQLFPVELPDLCDSTGRPLAKYGVLNSLADAYVHVCFDNDYDIGQRFHIYETARARELILRDLANGKDPALGSKKGEAVQHTGAGFNYTPAELRAESYRLPDWYREPRDPNQLEHIAIDIAKDFYSGYKIRDATKDEQLTQIDFIILDGREKYCFEVKCRWPHQKYKKLFLQTHESNSPFSRK